MARLRKMMDFNGKKGWGKWMISYDFYCKFETTTFQKSPFSLSSANSQVFFSRKREMKKWKCVQYEPATFRPGLQYGPELCKIRMQRQPLYFSSAVYSLQMKALNPSEPALPFEQKMLFHDLHPHSIRILSSSSSPWTVSVFDWACNFLAYLFST